MAKPRTMVIKNPYQGGLSLSAIAREVGKTPGFVCLLYQGKRNPRIDTAARIARITGKSLDELYGHWTAQRRKLKGKKKVA